MPSIVQKVNMKTLRYINKVKACLQKNNMSTNEKQACMSIIIKCVVTIPREVSRDQGTIRKEIAANSPRGIQKIC